MCLLGLIGDQLLGRVLLIGLTLGGVKVSGLHSSAELTLVPWWTEQLDCLDSSLFPQFLWEKVPVEVFDDRRLTKLLLVGK